MSEIVEGSPVKALVSKWKGQEGTVVEVKESRALPIAVKFDGSDVEVDFKREELEALE